MHTKGPWTFSEAQGMHHVILSETHLERIAETSSLGLDADTEESNARLIAAAPDLLAACKGALAALSQSKTFPADVEYAIWCLSHAIAKAEGR